MEQAKGKLAERQGVDMEQALTTLRGSAVPTVGVCPMWPVPSSAAPNPSPDWGPDLLSVTDSRPAPGFTLRTAAGPPRAGAGVGGGGEAPGGGHRPGRPPSSVPSEATMPSTTRNST
ncbi:ANTAR domain-containing protein, partial [Streptomyces sp. NPDC054837]